MDYSRILICGDRNWTDVGAIKKIIKEHANDTTTIIQGECQGADLIAKSVAKKLKIKSIGFPAEWQKYGKAAGPIRNQKMLGEGLPTIVFAFHDNIVASRGTKYMVMKSKKYGIPVWLYANDQFERYS